MSYSQLARQRQSLFGPVGPPYWSFYGMTFEEWMALPPRKRWYMQHHFPIPHESGDILSEATAGLGSQVLAPAAVDALQDPKVQAEIQSTLEAALASDATRAAIRPYLIEGAILIAAGIAVGGLAWSLISRRV